MRQLAVIVPTALVDVADEELPVWLAFPTFPVVRI
jgi:hypothetical protein